MLQPTIAAARCNELEARPALPETHDFVRGTVFRESGKHTLMKIIVFMRVM
jgi:hypothetical protein